MRKMLSAVGMAVMLSVGNTGCSSKDAVVPPAGAMCRAEGVEAPQWLCNAQNSFSHAYTAVGSAPMSKFGSSFSRREALAKARSELAGKIRADVAEKVVRLLQSADAGDAGEIRPKANRIAQRTLRTVMGTSAQMTSWESPSKTLYVLAGLPEAEVNGAVREAIRSDEDVAGVLRTRNMSGDLEKLFPLHGQPNR